MVKKFVSLLLIVLGVVVCGRALAAGRVHAVTKGALAPGTLALYGAAILPSGQWLAAGAEGLLLRSSDKGLSWERNRIKAAGSRDLYSLRFTRDGSVGWIVGEQGLVLRSENGGASWVGQQSGTQENLLKVAVIDSDRACAAGSGGVVACTSDAGKKWRVNKVSDVTFFDLSFPDAKNGWAVGEFETVIRTSDGGGSWQLQRGGNTADFTTGPLFTVTFEDSLRGMASGLKGLMLVTTDGGKTWQERTRSVQDPAYVSTLQSLGDATERTWLGGAAGTLSSSSDWVKWSEENPTFNDIADLAFFERSGLAVGTDGTVLRSLDGGSRWQPARW